MRPIDADAILNDTGNYFEMYGGDKYYHESIIQHAPTIEAIPVEFLENIKNNLGERSVGGVLIDYIMTLYRESLREKDDA